MCCTIANPNPEPFELVTCAAAPRTKRRKIALRSGAAMPNAIRHHAARHYCVENSGLRETRPAPLLGGGLPTSRPGGDRRDLRSESCGATAGSRRLPVPRACPAANDNGNANNDGIRATPSGDKNGRPTGWRRVNPLSQATAQAVQASAASRFDA